VPPRSETAFETKSNDRLARIAAGQSITLGSKFVGADVLPFPELTQAAVLRDVVRQKSRTQNVKRATDFFVASVALVMLSPLLLLIAALVRLTSRGPALFQQPRTGLNGTTFTVLKFRSMYVELQDVSGLKHTVEADPRVTPLGRILRKFSLDELPQLLNVLRGEMSIVGPRAHAVNMLALGVPYDVLVKSYELRHLVKPGITGLAQVRGYRGEVTDENHARNRIQADLEYVRTANFWLDLQVMLKTIPAVISGRAAL
jgi:lipopolysaccharide/colanic/teichoic acid biosynthesis glycosyltransferase